MYAVVPGESGGKPGPSWVTTFSMYAGVPVPTAPR